MWERFGCKTFRDYHDLYLQSDVLPLADVFENFTDMSMKNYGWDPTWYHTAPGLAWFSCMKKTGQQLELLSDPNMLVMFEHGIRGGVSMIPKRYAKVNNKYMKNYDPSKPSILIIYLDANSLYACPMRQPLPIGNFEWMTESDLENWR